ncbi:MAG: triose-phosphate isomerase [Candidatus Omnitrophota bacterium]|nr:triose-phosphate isomerase [Candidatus Omnitrophota bacterium]
MRTPVIAANWKLNKTIAESVEFVQQLRGALNPWPNVDVVLCPPFTALASVASALQGTPIGLGAQDMFWEAQGAFTGEISGPMLVDAGCRSVIVGHSERRTVFGETDEMVHRKLLAALTHGLTPILCIGETLAEREADQTVAVLARQLSAALGGCESRDCPRLIVAYEPVWAIGTGRNATPEQAQQAHRFIREWLTKGRGAEAAESIRIQYGGSVNGANAAELLRQADVDGALVGGASLKAEAFSAIVKSAAAAKAVHSP